MAGENLLVVEDERIVALHLRQQLLKLGYGVTSIAFSGDQALQQARQFGPDAILMDIHIEGEIDGIQTAALICDEMNIPIIYVTAYSEETTLKRARETRPFGYLIKPFTERELHATIQMALERRTVEAALRKSEEHLSLALDAAEMGSWELDTTTRHVQRQVRASRLRGNCQDGFCGSIDDLLTRIADEDRDDVSDMIRRVLVDKNLSKAEFRMADAEGRIRWLKVQGRAFTTTHDHVTRVIGVVQDVTERRNAEAHLLQAATVFDATRDGIIILDDRFRTIAANRGFCTITGYEQADLQGQSLDILNSAINYRKFESYFTASLEEAGYWHDQIQAFRKDGAPLHLVVNIARVKHNPGSHARYVAVFSDITAIRKAEEELQRLAHYDPLTGLPNRFLAMDRLEHAITARMSEHERVGLMFVDLDHFKNVNDTLGHSVGDDVLRTIARRMRTVVRAEDTVARLGGDEFMIIIDKVEKIDEIARLARRILTSIAQPVVTTGKKFNLSASIGISLYPSDGKNRESLIRAADTAMYAAKDRGRNRFACYTEEMTVAAMHYVSLVNDLQRGIAQNELRLHYQPQYSIKTGTLTGVEALIRWQHGQNGLLGAESVIPIAERSGLIVEIGEWVVRQACRQAREWRQAGLPPLRIAVNVSPRQIQDDRLVAVIAEALRETATPADQLEIEITESVLQDGSNSLAELSKMKEMGLTLTIDDFGTGYSCFSSLRTMPIQRIKIDRSFIQDIPDNRNSVTIAEAIIAMAHRLGLRVLAEGVETAAQLAFLRDHDCEESQGFFHARPMPPEAIARRLQRDAAMPCDPVSCDPE